MWILLLVFGNQALFGQSAENRYHLVAGSYHSFEAAQAALEDFEDEGFQPEILFPRDDAKKLYRVSIYQAEKRQEVAKYQALLKGQGRRAGWILEEKESPNQVVTRSLAGTGANIPDEDATEIHYLIVASLQGYNEALDASTELAETGFETEIIFPDSPEGLYRVSVYRATDREEIEAYAAMLKRQGKEKGWIYTEPITSENQKKVTPGPTKGSSIGARVSSDEGLRFHLIAGSYDTHLTALDFSEEMKSRGYQALVIFPDKPTGNYRVSIYHADNRDEVSAFNKKQKKQGKPAGWVLDRGE